jgi:hypothetical protein
LRTGEPLAIAVIHHHVPLYDRYGCDKRLVGVLQGLLRLGHAVRFGGKHVSDFETLADKARLPALGVQAVVAPLAQGEDAASDLRPLRALLLRTPPPSHGSGGGGGGGGAHRVGALGRGHPWKQKQAAVTGSAVSSSATASTAAPAGTAVDVVVLTLWFWSTAPMPRDFLPLVRLLAPAAAVIVLSDDVHFRRLELLATLKPPPESGHRGQHGGSAHEEGERRAPALDAATAARVAEVRAEELAM